MDPISIFVLLGYASLILELCFFALPSEASTYQLFFRPAEGAASGAGTGRPAALDRARGRAPLAKLLLYLLPTGLGVALFLIPPVAVFHPPVLDLLLPLPSMASTPVVLLGVLLVAGGRLTTFVSVLQLRRMQSEAQGGARGLFRRSRNPGLVGMYAFYLGNACLFPCAALFAGFLPYALNMHRRVLMEESHLSATLGPAYREYLQRVPRYLGVGTR